FAIKDFVDTSDDELAELMPTRHDENKLRLLQNDLREFKPALKKLQSGILPSLKMEISADDREEPQKCATPVSARASNDEDQDEYDRYGSTDRALRARK
ncbi:hypothetical protein JG688_00013292, partial [Phytophthora aleatoria]